MLLALFLLTLPLINPWVRGDGVGYYAYARAMLIDGNLRFEKDWLAGNLSFKMGRLDGHGALKAEEYTSTGHLANHFSVGPAMLWAPWLAMVHLAVLVLNHFGAHILADGYSRPYLVTMALATATYGFLGLYLAFRLSREYFDARWAFLGTLGIWFGSSLPVYMYFNPSWSHAHSAFVVALFLWYWHRTRQQRTPRQWVLLGLCSGLMMDVYYPNAILLLIPLLEALTAYGRAWRRGARESVGRLLAVHLLFTCMVVVAFLPTLITRRIIYGSLFEFGYGEKWLWTSPALKEVLFSANHGLLSWTPILIPAVLGLYLFRKADRQLAGFLMATFLAFYYFIASYPFWDGTSSFGNRYFVSLTSLLVMGLTASCAAFARLFERARRAYAAAAIGAGVFILWNLGLIFQWGMHMIPVRGPISWRAMAYNQLTVPVQLSRTLKVYLVRRDALMESIEQEDLKQLRSQEKKGE